MTAETGHVFGIDLGTTYSCVAHVDEYGRPDVIRNLDSQPTTPSVVAFDGDDFVVGAQAKRQARVRTEEVCSLVKRHMGEEDWRFIVHGQEYAAPTVSSLVLKALIDNVERVTGETVRDAVITVPAYFGDDQRKATKLAGELAGLTSVDIINEPTAAAFSYGFGHEELADTAVLVYDLGGGTFDTTVIKLEESAITVVATAGDHELGGADWDQELVRFLAQKFQEQRPDAGDPLDDVYDEQELLATAEETKQALSMRESVEALVVHNGQRAAVPVDRTALEQITAALLERTIEFTKLVLGRARDRGVDRIDICLLVGGMSKMPVVSRRLSEEFGLTPRLLDPDLAVAKGAALYGQKKELEALVRKGLVEQGKLDADQQLGEADPADVLREVQKAGSDRGMSGTAAVSLVKTQITNVTSRGFGIFAEGDGKVLVAQFLAHQDDPLPIEVQRQFYTTVDSQTEVLIEVFEQATSAESGKPEDNKVIVADSITGIPAGSPQGTPVEVTFAMQPDQTIKVTAAHEAVSEPLVLQITAGVGSEVMRNEEMAKVEALRHRT
ncbi:Hsp70 family protein [Streptomyces sp. NPDC058371]|jgi:molecular chaperone DnaK (HSP70)|uniref:Hsp70 family protein n=1 Tax=Streptomyces sp. NPDC058371 TaxID=3346463 RepID=UPI00365BE1B9